MLNWYCPKAPICTVFFFLQFSLLFSFYVILNNFSLLNFNFTDSFLNSVEFTDEVVDKTPPFWFFKKCIPVICDAYWNFHLMAEISNLWSLFSVRPFNMLTKVIRKPCLLLPASAPPSGFLLFPFGSHLSVLLPPWWWAVACQVLARLVLGAGVFSVVLGEPQSWVESES